MTPAFGERALTGIVTTGKLNVATTSALSKARQKAINSNSAVIVANHYDTYKGQSMLVNWFRNLWQSIIHFNTYDGTLPKKGETHEHIVDPLPPSYYVGGGRTTSHFIKRKMGDHKHTRRRKK